MYLLRVLLNDPSSTTHARTRVVVSEERLDIVSRPLPDDTITLSKSVFNPREAMNIRFDLGDRYFTNMEIRDTLSWIMIRLGYRAEGGAEQFPGDAVNWRGDVKTNQATVSTKAPPGIGRYELRLYSPGVAFLARKAFSVALPGQPAPPDWGAGARAPSDFPSPDYPFPKGGEFLDPSECAGPFELESPPEKMDLRFVRWSRREGSW